MAFWGYAVLSIISYVLLNIVHVACYYSAMNLMRQMYHQWGKIFMTPQAAEIHTSYLEKRQLETLIKNNHNDMLPVWQCLLLAIVIRFDHIAMEQNAAALAGYSRYPAYKSGLVARSSRFGRNATSEQHGISTNPSSTRCRRGVTHVSTLCTLRKAQDLAGVVNTGISCVYRECQPSLLLCWT